MREARS